MDPTDARDLNGRHIQLFLSLMNRGALSEAARELGLDIDSAAQMLDHLRRTLRDDLFIRAGRMLTATDYALEIAPRMAELLATLEGLSGPQTYAPEEDEGPITIAANVTEMLDEVILIRDAVKNAAPLARIRFLELGSRDRIEPMLESGDVDMVITVRSPKYAPTLSGCAFATDKHVLFYDPNCRGPVRTLEDYADAEHATLDFGTGGKSTIDEVLETHSVRRQVALSAPDAFALGALISGTRMIATMQYRLKRSVFSHLAYCEPPLYLPRQKFDLVWHRRSENAQRTIWLRETILNASELSRTGVSSAQHSA